MQGAAGGNLVVAEIQTAGRGRRGAAWFGAPGESLAFSILWRPPESKALWPRLALASGLAVAEACEAYVPIAGVKWPNDVWLGGRKAAGILVEAGPDFVVIGIGLNVNTAAFPPEIAATATSLAAECGRAVDRGALLGRVIDRFAVHARRIDAGFDSIVAGVSQRCVLTGREIHLQTSSGPLHGRCEGIGTGGELLVRTPSGLQKILQADDVRPRD
jgi:BirA family biotin operon repressor/biotin-[acetyl-CoA-carboxylase] ligase